MYQRCHCCSACLVLGLLLWEGGRQLRRQVRSLAAAAQATFWKKPRQEDKKFRCEYPHEYITYNK